KAEGISPKEHQDLARHSTCALTGRYTHTRVYDLAAAVRSLPIPTGLSDDETESLAATGTDGKNLSPNLGPQRVISGDFQRQTEISTVHGQRMKNPGKQRISAAFRGNSNDTPKVEAAGIEPASC